MKRVRTVAGAEPSFDETLARCNLRAPLATLEAMLHCGGPGTAVFKFPICTGSFAVAVANCTGSYALHLDRLEFVCEPDDDYKGDPVDCEPFLDLIHEEEQRKRAHWQSVCAVARPGKSWTNVVTTELRFPRGGVTVATGNGSTVRMTVCVVSASLDLFKGTVEERKAKDAARAAKRAAKQAAKK
jgi:hypothetical protein